MTDPHDPHEQVGAYVLDALDPDEAAPFEAHLASCEACTAELRRLREAIGVVATAARSTASWGRPNFRARNQP